MMRFVTSWICLALLCLSLVVARRPKAHPSTGQSDETSINGVNTASDNRKLAERVVAKKNPLTGEIELKEEQIPLLPDEEDQVDEVDDSTDPAAAYTKTNPCADDPCEAVKECSLNDAGQPVCNCIKECPSDSPIKVCSSTNKTFDSECHLYQQRCLCQRDLLGCTDPTNKDMQLEYLRGCRELALCTQDEMADFPRRMGDWLFQIMKELAERNELPAQYRKYEKRSEKKYQPGQPLPHPILWKFCDLDKGPNDRHVSRKELMPIRAPLIPMEHCIAPFLDDCDTDNDHKLTLSEWGKCLKLDEGEIEDICSHAMQQNGMKRPRSSGNEPITNDQDDEDNDEE